MRRNRGGRLHGARPTHAVCPCHGVVELPLPADCRQRSFDPTRRLRIGDRWCGVAQRRGGGGLQPEDSGDDRVYHVTPTMLVAQRELEGLVCSRAPQVRIGDAVSLAIRAERCDERRRLEETRGLGVVAGARECSYRQGRPAIVGSIWQRARGSEGQVTYVC